MVVINNIKTLISNNFIRKYSNFVNKFTTRTHNCGQLRVSDVGKRVELYGWVDNTKYNNKILIIRDSYGKTQCLINEIIPNYRDIRKNVIHNESIVKVSGLCRGRPESKVNPNLSTGHVEVIVDGLEIVNPADGNLPLLHKDKDSNNTTRLRYRYLDLRRSVMQNALRTRSQLVHSFRENFHKLGFIECETPTLFNRTPGGANEFIVPTRDHGKFYSLVQSPQQLKQLLMVGGIDRYFQFSRCYRDENIRFDRQPEFTQIDIELSFTTEELVMGLVEELLYESLAKLHNKAYLESFNPSDYKLPVLTYDDSFKLYGTDKPDLRFAWAIEEIDDRLKIDVPNKLDTELINKCLDSLRMKFGADLVSKWEIVEINSISSIVTSDASDESRTALGVARNLIAYMLEESKELKYDIEFAFTWVTSFPLFCEGENGQLLPEHHPFTAPTEDTKRFIGIEPVHVRAQHYDLVLNGQEIGGGSIRIHDVDLQNTIFDILGIDRTKFGYFMEALSSGCPPHGGIALGLDRLVAILIKEKSIRDVIAFPKTAMGRDLMTGCPDQLSLDILELYNQKTHD